MKPLMSNAAIDWTEKKVFGLSTTFLSGKNEKTEVHRVDDQKREKTFFLSHLFFPFVTHSRKRRYVKAMTCKSFPRNRLSISA